MKSMALSAEIPTPSFWFAFDCKDIDHAAEHIRQYSMIVKPFNEGNRVDISTESKVSTYEELTKNAMQTIDEFGGALIEEFIEGQEFTALVFENPGDPYRPIVLNPVESLLFKGETFKHYDLKMVNWQNMATTMLEDADLSWRLVDMANKYFVALQARGFGRLDIRGREWQGEVFFLEINFNPSIFLDPNEMGSCDFIMKHDKA